MKKTRVVVVVKIKVSYIVLFHLLYLITNLIQITRRIEPTIKTVRAGKETTTTWQKMKKTRVVVVKIKVSYIVLFHLLYLITNLIQITKRIVSTIVEQLDTYFAEPPRTTTLYSFLLIILGCIIA